MSPVFRHGRLRLYLLKLLDEAPRHGYEVIRLLQDRFLGVYAPSPGTIYPRLARLEEDGLVTHDEEDGRKVYRITEKGREEIRSRLDDLAELEEELADSVRDIAREVSQDVRDTVRSLREELTWAARDMRRDGEDRPASPAAEQAGGDSAAESPADGTARDAGAQDEASRIRAEARRARAEMREFFRSQRGPGRRPGWQEWAERARWSEWAEGARWQERAERADWPSWQDWAGRGDRPGPRRSARGAGGPPFGDLERLAADFAQELRSAAGYAGTIGDTAMGDLRDILTDTLSRIRNEIFGTATGGTPEPPGEPGGAAGPAGGAAGPAGSAAGPADSTAEPSPPAGS